MIQASHFTVIMVITNGRAKADNISITGNITNADTFSIRR